MRRRRRRCKACKGVGHRGRLECVDCKGTGRPQDRQTDLFNAAAGAAMSVPLRRIVRKRQLLELPPELFDLLEPWAGGKEQNDESPIWPLLDAALEGGEIGAVVIAMCDLEQLLRPAPPVAPFVEPGIDPSESLGLLLVKHPMYKGGGAHHRGGDGYWRWVPDSAGGDP